MRIAGAYTLPFAPARTYTLMQDPEALARAIPGCESLNRIGENEYRMKMKMALASLSGAFDGRVRITDQNPPWSFRMIVEGTGKIGFIKGDGLIKIALTASDDSEVVYEGDAQVGGTIAAVGQRLIEASAKMMVKKFFENLVSG
ncbi:MAG: SRPBCC family protein [Bryobacteraceae bacterium]